MGRKRQMESYLGKLPVALSCSKNGPFCFHMALRTSRPMSARFLLNDDFPAATGTLCFTELGRLGSTTTEPSTCYSHASVTSLPMMCLIKKYHFIIFIIFYPRSNVTSSAPTPSKFVSFSHPLLVSFAYQYLK